MQAIILAAGMGKRLKELTNNNTKCMVKVNGVSLIERMLNQLDELKLQRIVIVVGYKGQKLINYISTLNVKTSIEYIDNPIYDKTNNIYSLYLAKKHLLEDDTILLESDLIFEKKALDVLIDNPSLSLALVAKYESWMDGTVVTVDNEDGIIRFISKKEFKYQEIKSYYKTVNIYKFSKGFSQSHYVPFLEAYIKALGQNEYYEQVLKVIALLDNPEIKACRLEGIDWYEIDDIQDLDIAESIFTDEKSKWEKMNSRYGGFWRYPKLLDFCYLVNPYYPSEKLIDELKASFETLLREYPSGLRVNSLLAAKTFGVKQQHICIGNGAAELIKSIVSRLEGNIGVIRPTFEEYVNRYNKIQTVVFNPENNNFSYTVDDIIDYFSDKKISTMLLINPDNPSGNYIKKRELIRLCQWTQKENMRLIVDESFVDFADDDENNTLIDEDILNQFTNLVVIKSISKSFGVPGLRLGILVSGDESVIESIKKDVSIWNINSFAEFYMQICEKYLSDYKLALKSLKNVRRKMQEGLSQISYLRVIPSQANYFMCEVLGGITARSLAVHLLDKEKILIKDLTTKAGVNGEYVRLAIRHGEDNERLIDALKRVQL